MSIGGERLQALTPSVYGEGEPGIQLANALMSMFQGVDGIVQDWPAEVEPITGSAVPNLKKHCGWSVITDPEVAPEEWLLWCARLYGVTLTGNSTVEEQRTQIKELPPQKRGGIVALERAASESLEPGFTATFTQRAAGKAYHIVVAVSPEQSVTEETVTKNAILTQKAAGLIIIYSSMARATWESATKKWSEPTVTWSGANSGTV